MAANTPSTHSNWRRQWWSLNALEAFEAPRLLTSRMNDRSSEVTGQPGQVLNIPEVTELTDSAVGDQGEVSEQSPGATNQTLTIDQYRESSMRFRNDYKFQIAMREPTWAKMQGRALKERMEVYALGLYTAVNAANVRNISGDIVDSELHLLLAQAVTNDWPTSNRHLLVSGGQMTAVLGDDRFADAQFIGDGNLPVSTGRLKAVYGFEPLTSSLVRRESISGTVRTVNMAWIGKHPMGGAFCKGVQQDIKFDYEKDQLSHLVIASFLYGIAAVGVAAYSSGGLGGKIRLMQTTNA